MIIRFDKDEGEWEKVEAQWQAAGVPGGWSFTQQRRQALLRGPNDEAPKWRLSADAAAFSDDDRLRAGSVLARVCSGEVSRPYQFGSEELARVAVEPLPQLLIGIGGGLLAEAIKAALDPLIRERDSRIAIDLRLFQPDGTHKTAVVHADDPEVAKSAMDLLPEVDHGPEQGRKFDAVRRLWLPAGTAVRDPDTL